LIDIIEADLNKWVLRTLQNISSLAVAAILI